MSVSYMLPNGGWITNLSTRYGNTTFSYYQLLDASGTDAYIQRAIYVSEPEGAHQLYYYLHNNPSAASSATAPTVPGQAFDDGNTGSYDPQLIHRNTYHWGRRQFEALSGTVQSALSGSLSNALTDLTAADFNKADMKHWLLSSIDDFSITEGLSSEQDPSPDAAGSIPGLRTWYDYPHKPSGEPELLGSDPQVSCIARTLPDGSYQYITYNYYPNTYPYIAVGLVSDNESTYSKPDGTVGVLTNWFNYSTNSIDLIGVSNSAGQSWNIGYNGNHEITSITNALNQVTTLSWDSLTFNLTDIQFPGGKSIALNYYPAPYPPYYPLTNTSALLQQITIEPEGRVFTVNNYSAGLPISISDDRGLSWTNTWDGLNRLTSTAYPDGTSISNVYYRLDLVAAKDRMTNWTYYGYDGLDHLSTVTNANSAVTTYSWCGCGSLTAILDAQLNTTTLNYDNQGNLTNITFPDFSSLTYQYDLAGRMTNVFDGAGRSLQVGYNNQGLATTFTGANGLLLQKIYDAVNRPIFVTDANGITVTNQYDAINELIKRTWPDNVSEGYGYNAAGLFAYTNRDQQVTLYGLDGAGRITTVTNANQEITQFAYDSLDNITNLVDGLLHTTVWQYNEYGWLTNKLDGRGSNVLRYAYNPNGWVTNRWTPEKGNTGYAYDNVGNILTIHYPLSTISYLYNALNWLTNMVDAVGSHNFGWTPIGLPQSESDAWTTNGYTYSQGLRTALSIGSWNQSYSYDSVWRMTNTVSPAGAFNYQFLTPGSYLPTSIALPNGANILNGFDSLARFQSTALNNYWGHTLDGYSYGLDALGLKTNIVRNLGLTTSSVDVGYDSIDQITSWLAQETNGTPRQNEQLGFGYDVADNLHFRTNNLLVQTFNVDAANELTNVSRTGTFTLSGATPAPATEITVNGSTAQTYGDFTFAATNLTLLNGNNTFTNIAVNLYGLKVTNTLTVNLPSSVTPLYDSNGNLTNDGLHSLAYDAENQLTNVFVANQWRSDFIYDGLNRRRIERDYSWSGAWVLTNETHFIYDGYLLVQERDTNNNVLVTYTRGLDLSGSLSDAGGIGGLLARTDGNGSTFYHADGSGNITALMDGSENIVGRYLYNPFGKLVGRWGTMASVNRMQFSSMPTYSWGVGYWGRFWLFDPQRWANNDPIGEAGGINMTVGMNNNPVNVVDPFGLYNPISGPNGSVGSGSGLADASVFFPAVPTFPPAFDFNTGQSDPISMMLLPQFPFLDDSSIQTDDDIFALLFPFLAPEVGAGSLLKPKCPPAAEGTTLSLDTATTWGRADTLADHFARHGADFGAQTADEYANMASQFLQDSQSAGLPTKIDSQGVIRVFDPQSGTFGSFNPNGTTRTFFVPNNPTTYWGTQPGTLVP